ncbi:MAG: tetratricopeptide repeat protein [Nitrososphaerota archaeon]
MSAAVELLLFAVLVTFVATPAFADDAWIVAATDKTQYFTGESMEVSGYILDRKMPVVAMSVYDPDGIILSAHSVELQEDDGFTKTISLDSPFYDKPGIYLIDFDYGRDSEQLTFEITGLETPESEPPLPQIAPEVLLLSTDKKKYTDNEFITISGMVSALGDPTILIGIYDSSGFPTGFYTPQIDSNMEFSVSFLAKNGVNFKTPGTYSVKAHYGESKQITSFDFANPSPTQTTKINQNDNSKNKPAKPQIIIQAPKPKQETKPTQIIDFKPQQNAKPEPTPDKKETNHNEKLDNLSVEDKELGEMLNEITLNCDYSEYTDSIAYYDGMGPALMRLCSYEQAISYFDESLIEKPNSVDIITNKATALGKLGNFDSAIAYYDAALEIEPNYLPALNNKANALAQLGKFEEAISIYNTILDEDPSHTISQINLQKAKNNLAQYAKNQKPQDSVSAIQFADSGIKKDTKINYDTHAKKPSNVIEQIGNIFANFFGFLS